MLEALAVVAVLQECTSVPHEKLCFGLVAMAILGWLVFATKSLECKGVHRMQAVLEAF